MDDVKRLIDASCERRAAGHRAVLSAARERTAKRRRHQRIAGRATLVVGITAVAAFGALAMHPEDKSPSLDLALEGGPVSSTSSVPSSTTAAEGQPTSTQAPETIDDATTSGPPPAESVPQTSVATDDLPTTEPPCVTDAPPTDMNRAAPYVGLTIEAARSLATQRQEPLRILAIDGQCTAAGDVVVDWIYVVAIDGVVHATPSHP